MNVIDVYYKYRPNYKCFSKEDVIFEAFFHVFYLEFTSLIIPLAIMFSHLHLARLTRSMLSSEDGKLYVWGGGSEGQLGLGEKREASQPTLLPFDEAIVCVACGYYHTAFVTGKILVYQYLFIHHRFATLWRNSTIIKQNIL